MFGAFPLLLGGLGRMGLLHLPAAVVEREKRPPFRG